MLLFLTFAERKATLDHGYIPPDLLLVLVCPVHKGGRRATPKNYRPVALTSHIIRIFERVVRKALVAHLEKHCLLPDDQHWFRARRSTLKQLLVYWDTLLENMEQGEVVDVIYTDFSKAFDTVETGVLLRELKKCGIIDIVGCWLGSFLDPCSLFTSETSPRVSRLHLLLMIPGFRGV